jgi:type IV pilus biogenesis protein PilP
MPRARPANFAIIVDRAKRNSQRNATASISEAVATVAPRTVTPNIPSSASVARQATLDNAINLRRMNLIGVYGTPSNRRALVLMPNGRYKKVKVGDRIDGGRVVAIGDSQLQYQKGNRNHTLKIPSG